MPTIPQITAAKLLLNPQPYDADASKLTADAVSTLHIFLRKHVQDMKKAGRYTGIAVKLAAAVGIEAAQLQAVLTNVSNAGSKKALLKGSVEYGTQGTIDNELAFALLVMYEPTAYVGMGTMPSEMATQIRCEFHTAPCGCTEAQRTRGY